jgi:hypothetical protein
MSNRSTGASSPERPSPKQADAPAGGLPAGLSAPARRALAGAGVATVDEAAARAEAELLRLHGMGPRAIRLIRDALAARGMSFAEDGR